MKKFYCAAAAIIAAAVMILLLGSNAGLWEITTGSGGLLGLVAVLPAVIWIFFKGLNLINAGLYLGGVDYILIKKFLPVSLSVALIIIETIAVIICILAIYNINTSDKVIDEKASEEAEKTENMAEEKNG